MKSEIKMAALGYEMETGEIAEWLKRVGDPIERGEPIVQIETDKATIEMEATQSGTLIEILAEAGAQVPVGEVIGYIEAE